MLAKLLKYDLRALFKYWWIGAVTSVGLSALGGLIIAVFQHKEMKEETVLSSVLMLVGVLCAVGVGIVVFLTPVFILIRLHRSFFSDEGYLTYTLPTTRGTLLGSKLISSYLLSLATGLVLAFDLFLAFAIGIPEIIFSHALWREIFQVLGDAWEVLGGYMILYAFEGILLSIATAVCSILALYVCLTLASVMTKKHRILMAIGLYYGLQSIVSFSFQILFFSGAAEAVFDRWSSLKESLLYASTAVGMLGVLAVVCAVSFMLHWLETFLLERKWKLA